MAQQFLADKYVFNDPSGRTNLYSSGRALYYADELIWPTGLYGINTNELIIVSIDLASGCTEQQIIFPNNYQSIPKLIYSIYGLNQEDVVGSQISEITSGYAIIRFTHPIPNDQYNIQLFMFRNDTYKTISGTTYDLNAIQNLDSRWLDSYYGWDSQGVPDRMAFPYRTITGTESWAGESGVNMFLGKGNYDGGDITYGNLNIIFAPQAKITSPIGISAGKTVNFYNANIDITGSSLSGIVLGNGATANFHGENRVVLSSDTSTKYAVQGGSVNVFGNLYYNRPISSDLTIRSADGPIATGYDIVVDPNLSQTLQGNEISGVNRKLIFSNLATGVANSLVSDGQTVFVRSGSSAGFTCNKNLDFKFQKGASVSSAITFLESSSIENASIASSSSGINIVQGKTLTVFGDNNISSSSAAITGNGTIKCIGRVSYSSAISTGVVFDERARYVGIISSLYPATTSGSNGVYKMSNAQSVLDLIPTGSRILIEAGSWSGFSISGKNGLIMDFDENSKILTPITLAGSNQKITLRGVRYDAGIDVSFPYAIDIHSGSTGFFLADSQVRVPYYYSPYFITGTAPDTGIYYATGALVVGYTGTTFSESVSGDGISGWFFRRGGDHTGAFSISITGDSITGQYASASGSFNGTATYSNMPDTIFKYSSGVSSFYATGSLNGANITGNWYSGMCYYWENDVTGDSYLIGYKFPTGGADTGIYWDLGVDDTGRSGFYWSGSAGSFTDGVSGCNYTGYYASGAAETGGYFETSYGPEPFVTGYYFTGGLSGYYITGAGSLTGIVSSGLFLNTRYSISGNGSVSMQGALYNQAIAPTIVNLLGDDSNFNTGSLFDPWGIAYV